MNKKAAIQTAAQAVWSAFNSELEALRGRLVVKRDTQLADLQSQCGDDGGHDYQQPATGQRWACKFCGHRAWLD